MSMLIEINRGPNGEPGELVDARAYIRQLKGRLEAAEGQAVALQDILSAARLVVGERADGDDAVAAPDVPDSRIPAPCGTERIQALVDAVRAYDRRAQPCVTCV